MPQTLLGFLVTVMYSYSGSIISTRAINEAIVINVESSESLNGAGLSLGNFIILYGDADEEVLNHEFGHVEQSMILGPAYLFVIGIPSIFRAAYVVYTRQLGIEYYNKFYTEIFLIDR